MRRQLCCAASAIALVIVILTTDSCVAQNTAAPETVDPKACASQDRLRPGNGTAQRQLGSPNQTLSEKLERTEGVICPPLGVDPELPRLRQAAERRPLFRHQAAQVEIQPFFQNDVEVFRL